MTAQDEWAVEVLWRDWKKAGAKGPTSQFAPMDTEEQAKQFADRMRSDRDVTAVRILTRRAYYTPWSGDLTWVPITEEEREALRMKLYDEMFSHLHKKDKG